MSKQRNWDQWAYSNNGSMLDSGTAQTPIAVRVISCHSCVSVSGGLDGKVISWNVYSNFQVIEMRSIAMRIRYIKEASRTLKECRLTTSAYARKKIRAPDTMLALHMNLWGYRRPDYKKTGVAERGWICGPSRTVQSRD